MAHIVRLFVLLMVVSLLLPGCSAERNNPVSKTYHNITAHFNGYFLAREKMKEVEAKIWEGMAKDYNRVLPIFPPLDTTFTATLRPDLEDIIKKASIPIQRHKNSRWVDDSYVLIGKARFYQGNFEDAIRTFKYVNLTSKDDATKHEALVWLMRMFIETREFEEAVQVSDYLDKLSLNPANYRDHYLTRAYYLTVTGAAPQRIIDNLNRALPLIEKRDERSRVNFILAQLNQNLGQDQPAYAHYRAVLRKNPPYELGFYSKLSLGQVTEVGDASDRARVERYFRKLLKDGKNLDYRDKIYYEMARFELKQQNYDKALGHLRKSVQESTTNQTQKAYSYLLAGRIYFENLQKYRPAYVYYDSALQVYPQEAEDYMALTERRDILADFATQFTTIETEDSLQVLAKLDTATLHKRFDEIIAQQQAQQEAAQRLAEAQQAKALKAARSRSASTGPGTLTASLDNSPGGAWYFDNPATLATARSEFVRKWGDRALQDNWRRVNQRTADASQVAGAGAGPGGAAPATAPDPQAQKRAQYQAFMQNIPTTPEMLAVSQNKVEDALYNLAIIYQHKLQEPAKAIETYEQLVDRFPATPNKAEVYYSLYLLHSQAQDGKQDIYANLVKKEFPDSRFAKLIDNPQYDAISSADRELVRQLYDSAYTLYGNEKFPEAIDLTSRITREFPGNELEDKVGFLEVLLKGRTETPAIFKAALLQYGQDFPASPLQEKAQELLQTFADYESGKLSQAPVYNGKFAPPLPELDLADESVTAEAPAAPRRAVRPRAFARKTATASLTQVPVTAEPTDPQPEAAPAEPAEKQPEETPAATEAGLPAGTGSPETADPAVEAAVSPFQLDHKAPHLFVVVYPEGAASFEKIEEQFAVHNTRYHPSKRLEVSKAPFGNNLALLVLKPFADSKTASAYASMQKTKSSPLSKVSGVEFQTLVISADNLPVLLERQNVEEYQTFFQNNYSK